MAADAGSQWEDDTLAYQDDQNFFFVQNFFLLYSCMYFILLLYSSDNGFVSFYTSMLCLDKLGVLFRMAPILYSINTSTYKVDQITTLTGTIFVL